MLFKTCPANGLSIRGVRAKDDAALVGVIENAGLGKSFRTEKIWGIFLSSTTVEIRGSYMFSLVVVIFHV